MTASTTTIITIDRVTETTVEASMIIIIDGELLLLSNIMNAARMDDICIISLLLLINFFPNSQPTITSQRRRQPTMTSPPS